MGNGAIRPRRNDNQGPEDDGTVHCNLRLFYTKPARTQVSTVSGDMKLQVRNSTQNLNSSEHFLSLPKCKSDGAKTLELHSKDLIIEDLRTEIDKLKSVLAVVITTKTDQAYSASLLSSLPRKYIEQEASVDETAPDSDSVDDNCSRKTASKVRPESHNDNLDTHSLVPFPKDEQIAKILTDAIQQNDFLKFLHATQVQMIVECMRYYPVPANAFLIMEGDMGQHLYVATSGKLEILKGEHIVGEVRPGCVFGELAILYNCQRTASIRAVVDSNLYELDRQTFQTIMMKTNLTHQQECMSFLQSVPMMSSLPRNKLARVADLLEQENYNADEYIIREGEIGTTFFIVKSGQVAITHVHREADGATHQNSPIPAVCVLKQGDFFGEQALLREERRTASAVALTEVVCLTLDRRHFIELIGDSDELQQKRYTQDSHVKRMHVFQEIHKDNEEKFADPLDEIASNVELQHLKIVKTLGSGAFGDVYLVIWDKNNSVDPHGSYDWNSDLVTFAMKKISKRHIIQCNQQQHIINERSVMLPLHSRFICRLYKTFKDDTSVYFLLEPCLGGDLWANLKHATCFEEAAARFYSACVVEALEYLHKRSIVYRDLKPENMLLDATGYLKLVDFGFAKKLENGSKTWTFCGTPQYVAPEIIMNKGHDHAVDYWSLGIFIYELLSGNPPFSSSEHMKIYRSVLKGFDSFQFPSHLSPKAISLVKKLCVLNPAERLGCGNGEFNDIKNHRWYQGFDWQGLRRLQAVAPHIPVVRGPTDTGNFIVTSEKKREDTKKAGSKARSDRVSKSLAKWDIDF